MDVTIGTLARKTLELFVGWALETLVDGMFDVSVADRTIEILWAGH